MATIGSINVSITARTRAFERGLAKARRKLRRFVKDIPFANTSVAKFGAILSGAVVAGLTAVYKSTSQTIDSLAKMGDRLGIATERLAGLQYAASLAGVGVSQLNMGLQRMTRRIAEAGVGKGEALSALAELGLNPQSLASMRPEDQFSVIADALQKLGTQADRVRIAFKLFDSEGVALVNVLRNGSAGLAEMQREAERLGIAINRIDTAKVEAANDAVTRMRTAASGLSNTFTVAMAPIVEQIARRLTDSFANASKDSKAMRRALLDSARLVASIVDGIRTAGGLIVAAIGVARAALGMAMRWASIGTRVFYEVFSMAGRGAAEFVRLFDRLFSRMLSRLVSQATHAIAGIMDVMAEASSIPGALGGGPAAIAARSAAKAARAAGAGVQSGISGLGGLADSMDRELAKFEFQYGNRIRGMAGVLKEAMVDDGMDLALKGWKSVLAGASGQFGAFIDDLERKIESSEAIQKLGTLGIFATAGGPLGAAASLLQKLNPTGRTAVDPGESGDLGESSRRASDFMQIDPRLMRYNPATGFGGPTDQAYQTRMIAKHTADMATWLHELVTYQKFLPGQGKFV